MVLLMAVLYFLILTVCGGIITKKQVKSSSDFVKSSQGLSWILVCFGFVLLPLGSGHTLSLWEASAGLGASVLWWGILTGGIFVPLMMLWLGPLVRSTGKTTFPEILEMLFGVKMGWLHSAVQFGAWTALATAETLACSAAIYGLTNGAIPFAPHCVIISVVLIVLYVYFGGVLQIAWLNVVNAFVMIAGSYIALIFFGGWLAANFGGWEGIKAVFDSAGQASFLTTTQITPALVFNIIIPVVVLHCSAGAVSQMANSIFFAARSDRACRKGVFIATAINSMAAIPWVLLALGGVALAKSGSFPGITGDPKLSVFEVAHLALPAPVVGLLAISLLAAVLSTAGAMVFANATILSNDIIIRAIRPGMTEKGKMISLKVSLIISALLVVFPALNVPVIFPVFLWAFSFGIPVFVCYIMAVTFKISAPAAWITVIVAYIVDFVWTFATPSWAQGPLSLNMYPVTIVSIVLGVLLTVILPGKPSYLKQRKAAMMVRVGDEIRVS